MNDRRPTPPDGGRDPHLTALLRAAYAPPRDGAYWDGLEARIMSKLAGSRPAEWWDVLAQWRRAGLVAAGIAAAVALAAAVQTRAAEAHVAYEAVVDGPAVVPGQPGAARAADARALRASEREATLRYVMAY